MATFQQSTTFRAFTALATISLAAIAAPAFAAPVVNVTYSPSGLSAIAGAVNGVDLTGRVGQTNFTLNAGANAVTVAVTGGAAVVQGSVAGAYAAPVTGASGATLTTPYLSTGSSPSTISMTFATSQSYLGFLWGSIGAGDYLAFLDDLGVEVYRLTGAVAQATAPGYNGTSGAQGYNGSQYTLVNFTGSQFKTVVLGNTSGFPSFESGGYQYANVNVTAVPEPTSIALAGMALLGCIAFRRKA